MQTSTRVAAALVGIAAAAFGTALPATAAPAPATPAVAATPSTAVAAGNTNWAVRTASVDAPAAAVAAPALQPGVDTVKVTTTRDVAGHPVITTTTVPAGQAVATVDAAQATPGAVSVSVDTQVHMTGYNDPMVPKQWALKTLGGETFHARTNTSGVTVAVLDTGIDATHPDLKGTLVSGAQFIGGGSGASTGNGLVDGQGHGTHVAGIIAAVANNGIGAAGLTPGTKVMSVRVMDNQGIGWSSDIARGIIYAADHGAKVINMSLGGSIDPAVDKAVQYANSKGLVIVAAAGNERQKGNPVTYPAAYNNVIGVAATTETNGSADFSNTGSYVDVAAPGTTILSTYPTAKMASGYAYMNGTSMATPFVAAAAAGLKAFRPSMTNTQVQQVLSSTATDLGTAGRDNYFGAGLINPNKALCTIGGCAATMTWSAATAYPRWGTPATSSVLVRTALGSPIAGAPVKVCHYQVGVTTPSCYARTTDSVGRVSTTFTARRITTTTVSFAGNASARAASTSMKFNTTFDVRGYAGAAGTHIASATVAPRVTYVNLDRWDATNRRWVYNRRGVTTTTGYVKFSGLPNGTYRAIVPATNTVATGASGSIVIR